MNRQKICPLCGNCIGLDVYIDTPCGKWYHHWCGKKTIEKANSGEVLNRKEKKYIRKMIKADFIYYSD